MAWFLFPSDYGSFDGSLLLWKVPLVLSALVGEGAGFKSRSFGVGLEGFLLDEATVTSKGMMKFLLGQREALGRYRVWLMKPLAWRKCFNRICSSLQSLVVENMYKESYTVLLMYEHLFSLVSDDGH